MKAQFDESWKGWIQTNIDRGCCKDGIFKILLDEGFSYDAIVQQMAYKPSSDIRALVNPLKHAERTEPTPGNAENAGVAIARDHIFIPNAKRLDDDRVEFYELEGFLNKDECAKLIDRIRSRLQPSGLSSYEADNSYRTSRTCFLETLDDDFVAEIDSRICRMLGVHAAYSESIQGQFYEEGQEFKAHTDYFEAHEMATHASQLGQRTYTFMIYLNDVESGGVTEFTHLDLSCRPKLGSALIWNSLNPDGSTNSNTMHHAHKVEKGYKAIITKWFRSRCAEIPAPNMYTKELNEFVPNYTRDGFATARLPEALFHKIRDFFEAKKNTQADEHVPGGFIYNESKLKKRSSTLVDLSDDLREQIHDVMKPLMESWSGKDLAPTYVYGIRVYHDQAILKSHRDRLETHIISAIINVDQEVNVDWPLVIDDNYYRRHHVLLKPGDMIFYEGARLTHGRPIAFDGNLFANIFCHFKPKDYVPVTKINR